MAKYATRELVRQRNGKMAVEFIDANTGERLSSLDGYTLISAGNETDLALKDGRTASEIDEETLRDFWLDYERQGGGDGEPEGFDTFGGRPLFERDATNNFGFVNRPEWMKLGNLTKIGAAGNLAVNANNMAAVNAARQYIGLDPVSTKEAIKSLVKDNDGVVAEVEINGKQYVVGLKEEDSVGRTTLTADEARKRSLMTGGIKEVSPAAKEKAITEFKEEFRNPSKNRFTDKMSQIPVVGKLFDPGFKEKLPPAEISPTRSLSKAEIRDREDTRRAQAAEGLARQAAQKRSEIVRVSEEKVGRTTPAIGPGVGSPAHGAQGARSMPERGKGLAALVPDNYGYVKHNNPGRNPTGVYENMTERTIDALDMLASQYPEGISINSAYRSPEVNKSVGGRSASRHMSGEAVDWDISGFTDEQKADAVERATRAGFDRVGTYSSENVLHLDFAPGYKDRQGNPTNPKAQEYSTSVHPMYNMSVNNMPNAPSWFTEGLSRVTNPNPTVLDRDMPEAASVRQIKDAVSNVPVSPAQAAAMGLIDRSQLEKEAITFALAGELGADRLAALVDNPESVSAEIANMVTTIENRAGSGKYAEFGEVFDPSQYNSLMQENWQTTTENYNQYGHALRSMVESFYTPDGIKPSDYNYTSYHANYVSPSWSSDMKNSRQEGDHIFGVLDNQYDYPNPNKEYAGMSVSASAKGIAGVGRNTNPTPTYSGGGDYSYSGGLASYSPVSTPPSPSSPAGGAQAAGGWNDNSRSSSSSSGFAGRASSEPPSYDYDRGGPQ